VEKTENSDFTDFQTRILSYNQRSTKLFQEPILLNNITEAFSKLKIFFETFVQFLKKIMD
jgi:hypothetical protein